MGASPTLLLRFNDHGEDFLEQIITGDETLVHQYCPEASDSNHMMMSSMRCKHGSEVRIHLLSTEFRKMDLPPRRVPQKRR
jgi:hypothetical protein